MSNEGSPTFRDGLLVGALALAVVVQILEFPQIDDEVGSIYAARHAPADADLRVAASEVTPTIGERFGLYAEVGRFAPEAEIVDQPGSGLRREQLFGLGRARAIVPTDTPLELTEQQVADLQAHVVAEGTARTSGPYQIAIVNAPPSRLVTVRSGETLLLVDEDLLPETASW